MTAHQIIDLLPKDSIRMKLRTPGEQFTKGTVLVYNDRRPGRTNASATVLETDASGMIVQFDDRADTTKIAFSDHDWMDYITIEPIALEWG